MNDSGSLKQNRIDYIVSLSKGLVGTVPVAGSLLAEILTVSIPNQQIDRIIRFAEILIVNPIG
ncbi:hypothetical protein K4A83_12820 [Spirulina subsalsa FACHB-351]|uniref:Uncharacterized protein n=1 Tax=Spirulina subsalsa FACHB-351 TaxID=234711 RepID=A0ABT3L6K6_9CYAN|nr:hypothetical protein [Spirulina subsalsa FACHB-351]